MTIFNIVDCKAQTHHQIHCLIFVFQASDQEFNRFRLVTVLANHILQHLSDKEMALKI